MGKYETVKLECLRAARIAWRINQHPPFVVGFKNGESFTMLMPRFSSNQEMQVKFFETISSSDDWDAIAMFNSEGKGVMTIILVVPDKTMTTSADIIDDYGGVYLSDFSEWQDLGGSNMTLSHCLSRDVGNAIQSRVENCG